MDNTLINASNLKYIYKDTKRNAIDMQTFSIYEKEVVGIIGPNGAGKTTLCLAIKGIIPHKMGGKWGGSLDVCRLDVSIAGISSLSNYVAMTFQNPETQIVGTTVEEDLAFLPENLGIDPLEIRQSIEKYMSVVRLPLTYKKRPPFNMSGGEKQRLAIASSLIAKPKVIILDEPTTELDPVGKQEVIKVVEQVVREGESTFIIVEQDLDHLITIADRLFVIVDGKIEYQGKTRDILAHADYLEKIEVNVPDVVRIWNQTPLKNKYPLFLTVEEAARALNQELQNKTLTIESANQLSEEKYLDQTHIQFEHLSFAYNEHKVLKDINLSIKKGDFCAVLGKNGAGKTTLVKHMNGLLKPTGGKLLINNEDTKGKTVAQLSSKVSYVFQNPDHQIFAQTVEEEIAFGPRNLGWSEEKINESVEYALRACSLQDYRKETPLSLERGLKQLLILASVISMDVDIFIVDEPTTGLSKKYKAIIGDVLKSLNERGKTIILVTHDMHFVAKYAKSAIVINDGNISLEGKIDDIFCQIDELRKAYVYPPQVTLVANQLECEFASLPISVEELIAQMEWSDIHE